jgi:hypothetical protein
VDDLQKAKKYEKRIGGAAHWPQEGALHII